MAVKTVYKFGRRLCAAIQLNALFYIPLFIFIGCFGLYTIIWRIAAGKMEDRIYTQIQQLQDQGIEFQSKEISISGYPFFLRGRLEEPVVKVPQKWKWSVYRIHIEVSPLNIKSVRVLVKGMQTLTTWGHDTDAVVQDLTSKTIIKGSAEYFAISIEENDIRFELRDVTVDEPAPFASKGVRVAHILGNIIPERTVDGSKKTGPAFSIALKQARSGGEVQREARHKDLHNNGPENAALRENVSFTQIDIVGAFTDRTQSNEYDRALTVVTRDSKLDLSQLKMTIAPPRGDSYSSIQAPGDEVTLVSAGNLAVSKSGYLTGGLDVQIANARALGQLLLHYGVIEGPKGALLLGVLSSIPDDVDKRPVIAVIFKQGSVQIAGHDVIKLPRIFEPDLLH